MALRSPSAPRSPPRIFNFGSSRIFQIFCARAVFFFSACPRLQGFSARFSEISEPFSFSSFAPCCLAFSCVPLLYFGVYLLSFCAILLCFYAPISPFSPCVISCLLFCVARLFFCAPWLFLRGLPLVLVCFPQLLYDYIIHSFFIVCQHFLSCFDYFFVLYCNL